VASFPPREISTRQITWRFFLFHNWNRKDVSEATQWETATSEPSQKNNQSHSQCITKTTLLLCTWRRGCSKGHILPSLDYFGSLLADHLLRYGYRVDLSGTISSRAPLKRAHVSEEDNFSARTHTTCGLISLMIMLRIYEAR